MSTILYYVTGHGFGHATRAAQVIEELATMGHTVVIRTSAPRFLFPTSLANVSYDYAEVDSGVAQIDSLTTDIHTTFNIFTTFFNDLNRRVAIEHVVIDKAKPDLIMTDIAPIAVLAGDIAHIPTVVIGNFLWDWILEGFIEVDERFKPIAEKLTSIYEKAATIYRTPLNGGMERYSRIIDIPLIARKSTKTKTQVREELSLSKSKKYAFISLRGMELDRFYDSFSNHSSVCEIIALGERDEQLGNLRLVDRSMVSHPDMVIASDLVIGKLGYGLCSEIIVANRPVLYTPRSDFVEYEILANGVKEYVQSLCVEKERFFGGALDEELLHLINSDGHNSSIERNGAEVASMMINQKYCTINI